MPWKLRKIAAEKRWHHRPLPYVGALILASLSFLAVPYVKRPYHHWTGWRRVQRAQAAYAVANYKQALLDARGALLLNSHDVEANRIIAKTLEAVGSTEAVHFRGLIESLAPGDPENLLAMGEDALKAGDRPAAERALELLRPPDRQSARYHSLMAELAQRRQDDATAATHLAEAIRLAPREEDYRYRLAKLRLASKTPEDRAMALAMLEELRASPARRLEALRVLLDDALMHRDRAAAGELSKALASDPKAAFSDKLTRLSALRSVQNAEFYALLEEMQQAAAADPKDAYRLIVWMNEHNLALSVPDWTAQLPPETTSAPPICIGVADALARASNWTKLKDTIAEADWKQFEPLRFAHLSRALERLGDRSAAGVAWTKAMAATQARPEALELLSQTERTWGQWPHAEEALWRRAALPNCPRWAAEELWAAAEKRLDSAQLYEASRLKLKADPKSVEARNNFIFLALLTGHDGDSPLPLAEALHREAPANPFVASTYGLSLYQQGRLEEAATVMAGYSPGELHQPQNAFYHGLFLAGAGQFDPAWEYLQAGAPARRLPEERALTDFLYAAFEAREFQAKGDPSAASTAWSRALAAAQARVERLEILFHMAQRWEWPDRVAQTVLQLAGAEKCPPWALTPLWTAALSSGDSDLLYKASRLIFQAAPADPTARAHYLLLALLTRREGDAPRQMAEAWHKEQPGLPEAAQVYALALLGRGQPEDALASLESLPPGQLSEPRLALYHGLCLAAAGRTGPAQQALEIGAPAALFSEEKELVDFLRKAGQVQALDRAGNAVGATAAWNQVLATAATHPAWLEILAHLAQQAGSPQRTEQVLWKLAAEESCPRWAADTLWLAALQRGNSAQRLQAAKLLVRLDPASLPIRLRYLTLALLTSHAEEDPDRLAESLSHENPASVDAAAIYGLSLHLHGRDEEAIKLMAALPPRQLDGARASFYYGVFLTAGGQALKAREYLRAGAGGAELPEEKALLGTVQAALPPHAAR